MNNKKVLFKVESVREYDKDFIGQKGTWVCIAQYLYEGDAFAQIDTTVYDMDDFSDIHSLYLKTAAVVITSAEASKLKPWFEYDYNVYSNHLAKIKLDLMRLQNG